LGSGPARRRQRRPLAARILAACDVLPARSAEERRIYGAGRRGPVALVAGERARPPRSPRPSTPFLSLAAGYAASRRLCPTSQEAEVEGIEYPSTQRSDQWESSMATVAVITGGSTGMASGRPKLFVDEGAHVFISGRRQESAGRGRRLIGRTANLADLDRLFDTVRQRPVDGLWPKCRDGEQRRLARLRRSTSMPPSS